MKNTNILTIASTILLVAGCSYHEKKTAQYDTYPSSSTMVATSERSENRVYAPSTSTTIESNSTFDRANRTTADTASSANANVNVDTRTDTSTSDTSASISKPGDADSTLSAQVRQAVSADPSFATIAPNLQITAVNGAIPITGNVQSEQQKQNLEAMVKRTSGVVSVNNQVQVSAQSTSSLSTPASSAETAATPPSPTSDQNSQSRIYSSSKTVAGVDSSKDAQTSDQLSPTSDKPNDQTRVYSKDSTTASSTATTTPPSPDNAMASSSTSINAATPTTPSAPDASATIDTSSSIQAATDTDRTLGQQIMSSLRADTSIANSFSKVKFNVNSGKVTLTGNVKSEDEKKNIESAVQKVTGVSSVDNQLQVSSDSSANQ